MSVTFLKGVTRVVTTWYSTLKHCGDRHHLCSYNTHIQCTLRILDASRHSSRRREDTRLIPYTRCHRNLPSYINLVHHNIVLETFGLTKYDQIVLHGRSAAGGWGIFVVKNLRRPPLKVKRILYPPPSKVTKNLIPPPPNRAHSMNSF